MNHKPVDDPTPPSAGHHQPMPASLEPDPATWPGLLHRLTRDWSGLRRLLVALVVLSAVGLGIAVLLDPTLLQLGPFGIQLQP